ncbi:MAG: glycosyltransferase family 9 protein, partial [Gammaproteobacteria bacterium]|nr:glycosyltransferase family 9 protein [Gammaproteobacteria bacterium]
MNPGPPDTTPAALPEHARILCIRFSALGDMLLTLPAVDALRSRYPGAHIGYLTDTRQTSLLEASRSIDEILAIDRKSLQGLSPGALTGLLSLLRELRAGRWDAVIDFQSYTETALLGRLTGAPLRLGRRYKTTARWLYSTWIDEAHPEVYMPFAHLDSLSRAGLVDAVAPGPLAPYLSIPTEFRTRWEVEHAGLGLPPTEMSPRIGLFVGAAEERRRWPADRFAKLAVGLDAATELPLSFLVFA